MIYPDEHASIKCGAFFYLQPFDVIAKTAKFITFCIEKEDYAKELA